MSLIPSKRQQARNERALQEIIKTVPGNDRCADCQTRNPGWASWSNAIEQLGVFLCMRCAALHRKLGTHVSKVKSLSMDSWSNDQVENMKRNGNASSNRTFNPLHKKPEIPLDVDEVDMAMERFIRQKYELRTFSGGAPRPTVRHDTGSTSSEDQPPPLPPKPHHSRFRFGLRAASSTLPASRVSYDPAPVSPDARRGLTRSPSPVRVNKPSRVFGASVGATGESFESKLATLRDMGFSDDRRNSTVLKGLSGNLERTVESLVRLGEGGATSSQARNSFPPRNDSVNGSVPDRSNGAASGPQKSNPFDLPENQPTQPQRQISTSAEQSPRSQQTNGLNTAHPSNTFNPFDHPGLHRSASQPLDQSFQGLQISQTAYPSATAGFPSQQQPELQHQQSPTRTMPQYLTSNPADISQNPYQQQPPLNGAPNPFLPASSAQQFAPTNPYLAQYSGNSAYSEQQLAQQQQQQQIRQLQAQVQQQQQQLQLQNPQYPSYVQQPPFTNLYQQYPQQQQPQPLVPQPTGRADKNTIMALYNYPQLAPTPPPSIPSGDLSSPSTTSTPPVPKFPPGVNPMQTGQRSASTPVGPSSGSRNPFLPASALGVGEATAVRPAQLNGGARHASQESVDTGGWQSGRHSPDAFASLSARFVR
ncbi:MAG: hypothetical protein M1835_003823 [Candelina submexicana]|nr:MAG: hypothetical protein M1835_003823 [Candelina submexicana]